jgi:hypothetical protein
MTKQNWKVAYQELLDSLSDIHYDCSRLQKALSRPKLTVEFLTEDSYNKLNWADTKAIATLSVGFAFVDRDLRCLLNFAKSNRISRRLEKKLQKAFDKLDVAYRKFRAWERKGYPRCR